jgi:ABC-type branched-subunit amino acid transport system substrate-binding protein
MKRVTGALLIGIVIATTGQAEPVRLGVLTDLSGGMASWGQQTRIGAEIASDEITKAGGEVKLYFGDHQLQAKNAVSEFKKLTDLDKVDAIYSEFTPTTVAIAPLSNTKRVPVIYAAAAASPVTSSPYIFKSYLDYIQGCKEIGEYWKSQNVVAIGILKANLEFGELCAQGLKQIYPEAIEATYNPGDDVATQLLLFKSKGVTAIVNTTFEPDLLRMLKGVQNLKWNPLLATQSDAVASQTRELFPELLERITVFALPPLPSAFIERVRNKDPHNTLISISAAGLGYLHIKQLYAARLRCPKGDAQCMQHEIAGAERDQTTGFEFWENRVARFAVSLRSWHKGLEVEQLARSDSRG